MTAPTADVVRVRGKQITVRCPYCGGTHQHAVEYLGRTEHRGPGCGLTRSAADRLTGYRFTTEASR